MSVRSNTPCGMVLLATLLGLLGCGHAGGQGRLTLLGPGARSGLGEPTAPKASLAAPGFTPSSFVRHIDNPYFPLTPGTVYSYREATDRGVETDELEVTHDTRVVLGVETTVIHDRVLREGALAEDTYDWYAQDGEGNVWYLGEDTKEYENGVVVSTAGSWEAGKDGARPGIIMEAHPRVGDRYRQEFAPGEAEDMASVLNTNKTVSVPYGRFEHCLQTMEFTPLAPGARTHKYYAPGVGLVLEDTPRGGHARVELIAVTRR